MFFNFDKYEKINEQSRINTLELNLKTSFFFAEKKKVEILSGIFLALSSDKDWKVPRSKCKQADLTK